MKVYCLVVVFTLVQLLQHVQLAAVNQSGQDTEHKGDENSSHSSGDESISKEDCRSANKLLRQEDNNNGDIHIYVSHNSHTPLKYEKRKKQLNLRIPFKKHYTRSEKKLSKVKTQMLETENSTNQTKHEVPNTSSSPIPPLSILPVEVPMQNIAFDISDTPNRDDYDDDPARPLLYDSQNEQTEIPEYTSNEYYVPISRIIKVTGPHQSVPIPYDISFHTRQRNQNKQQIGQNKQQIGQNKQQIGQALNIIPIYPTPVQHDNVVNNQYSMSSQSGQGGTQAQNIHKILQNSKVGHTIRNEDNKNELDAASVSSQNLNPSQNTVLSNSASPLNTDIDSNVQYIVPQNNAIKQPYETQSTKNLHQELPGGYPKYPSSTAYIGYPPQYSTSSKNELLPNNQYTLPNNGQYPVNSGVPPINNGNPVYWQPPPTPPQNFGPSKCCVFPLHVCCQTINNIPSHLSGPGSFEKGQ